MNRILIIIATMALFLTGCGDNDVANTEAPPMLDNAMDSAGDTANEVKDTTRDVVEDLGDTASDATKIDEMSTEQALEYMDKEIESYKEKDQ